MPSAASLGFGDVDGPASSTDNAVARFDGTTGKRIQNSVLIIADTTGALSGFTTGVGITFHGGGAISGASGPVDLTPSGAVPITLNTASSHVKVIDQSSGFPALYFKQTSPASGNYTLIGDGTNTLINAASGGSITFRVNNTLLATLSSAGVLTLAGPYVGSTSTRSGPGACDVTTETTKVTTTGVLDALTLADGVNGQIKRVVHDVEGGSFVLTPTTRTVWSTYTSTAVGESISVLFATTRGWMIVGSYAGVIA